MKLLLKDNSNGSKKNLLDKDSKNIEYNENENIESHSQSSSKIAGYKKESDTLTEKNSRNVEHQFQRTGTKSDNHLGIKPVYETKE